MLWKEIKIHTSFEALEPISMILENFNIKGIVIREPLKNKAFNDMLYDLKKEDYPETGIYLTFYLLKDQEFDGKLKEILQAIQKLSSYDIDLSPFEYEVKEIQARDWENEWKKHYHTVEISEGITIVPKWEAYSKQSEEEIVVKLDPGMAFGTGTHASTILSIQALEKYLQEKDKVIDVGCGSGILSIIAAKLGAKSVLSLDVDPLAITSARQNAQLNHINHKLEIRENNLLEGISEKANIIVSNILADIIILFPQDAYDCLEDGGLFISSGIIKEKQDLVEDHLTRVGFTIKEVNSIDHWVSIVAEK